MSESVAITQSLEEHFAAVVISEENHNDTVTNEEPVIGKRTEQSESSEIPMGAGADKGLLVHRPTYTDGLPVFTKKLGVFLAQKCNNSTVAARQYFRFSEIETDTEFGDFDISTGILTVTKPGLFQFNFKSHVYVTSDSYFRRYELRVNDIMIAYYCNRDFNSSAPSFYLPVSIFALLSLKSGDKVGVFKVNGPFYDDHNKYVTRLNLEIFNYWRKPIVNLILNIQHHLILEGIFGASIFGATKPISPHGLTSFTPFF